jgi:hypothetical protein
MQALRPKGNHGIILETIPTYLDLENVAMKNLPNLLLVDLTNVAKALSS